MKKLGLLTAALLLTGVANARADVYKDCVDKASNDETIIACILNGAEDIYKVIERKYEEMASLDYFKDWNQGAGMFNGNFKNLLEEWTKYRDDYCSLYGYSSTQGQGTLTRIEAAECVLELTKRQNKDITVILNNYKQAIADSD